MSFTFCVDLNILSKLFFLSRRIKTKKTKDATKTSILLWWIKLFTIFHFPYQNCMSSWSDCQSSLSNCQLFLSDRQSSLSELTVILVTIVHNICQDYPLSINHHLCQNCQSSLSKSSINLARIIHNPCQKFVLSFSEFHICPSSHWHTVMGYSLICCRI